MKDVYYTPSETTLSLLDRIDLKNNIKEDRTDEDLLFQVMPEFSLLLSSKIKTEMVAGKKVFLVNDGYLMACFDKDITKEAIVEIAKQKPYCFAMRGTEAATDDLLSNVEQLFKQYSPNTVLKVI